MRRRIRKWSFHGFRSRSLQIEELRCTLAANKHVLVPHCSTLCHIVPHCATVQTANFGRREVMPRSSSACVESLDPAHALRDVAARPPSNSRPWLDGSHTSHVSHAAHTSQHLAAFFFLSEVASSRLAEECPQHHSAASKARFGHHRPPFLEGHEARRPALETITLLEYMYVHYGPLPAQYGNSLARHPDHKLGQRRRLHNSKLVHACFVNGSFS